MEPLKSSKKKSLKKRAHHLKAVVWLGEKGHTPAVDEAIDEALTIHELIKIRLRRPEDKKAMAETLAATADAHLIGLIGHSVILFREKPEESE